MLDAPGRAYRRTGQGTSTMCSLMARRGIRWWGVIDKCVWSIADVVVVGADGGDQRWWSWLGGGVWLVGDHGRRWSMCVWSCLDLSLRPMSRPCQLPLATWPNRSKSLFRYWPRRRVTSHTHRLTRYLEVFDYQTRCSIVRRVLLSQCICAAPFHWCFRPRSKYSKPESKYASNLLYHKIIAFVHSLHSNNKKLS